MSTTNKTVTIMPLGAGAPLHLSGAETVRRLPYARLVPQIHRSARELRLGGIDAPPRLVTPMGKANGSMMCMPAVAGDLSIVKLLTVLPGNGVLGLPTVQGQVSVFDAVNGRPLAQLDAESVTSRRTAAVSLAGVERLLHAPPRSVLVVGSGVQAASHIDAFADYFGTTDFTIAARSGDSARRMREMVLDKRPQLRLSSISVLELAEFNWDAVDVVICATTAITPVLPQDVPSRVLVIGVGAYRIDMIELPNQLLRNRNVVVDTIKGARHEAGDLIDAGLDWLKIIELCDLDQEIRRYSGNAVFKTVGHAAWDLAACRTALEN